jgi:hypothetical protein
MWLTSLPGSHRLLALAAAAMAACTGAATAETPSPAKVRTIRILPQTTEERRAVSDQSQQPLAPNTAIVASPDPRVVQTIRVPKDSAPR